MKDKTIVMFGDSLTDYFPMEKLKDLDARIINSGQAGDTVAEMKARVFRDVVAYAPDVVIMQGGANDFLMSLYPGYEVLADRIFRLAETIKGNLPDAKIYVESLYPAYTKQIGLIPSWADGKSNEEIERINRALKKLCKEGEIRYMDIYGHLIGEDGQLPRDYTIDGIHLREPAYEIVSQCILQSVL